MKKANVLFRIFLIVFMTIATTGCSAIATTKIVPVPVEIETSDNVIVLLEEQYQIETTVKSDLDLGLVDMPKTKTILGVTVDAIYDIQEFTYSVTYSSANEKIATVDENGVITPNSIGKTIITITADEISKDIAVSVKEYYIPESMPIAVVLPINETITIFEDMEEWQILKGNFSIENTDIASIDKSGVIHGLQHGTTKMYTTLEDGSILPTAIDVLLPLTDIQVSDKTVTVGKTVNSEVELVPSDADYEIELTYTSADTSIATISEKGVITGKKAGTTTITVKTKNGIEKSFTITVKAQSKPNNITPAGSSSVSGGVLGSGGSTSSGNSNSYYPEGSILYGYTKEEIIAMYPEPAYGTTSFENENAKAPWYWQHATITYEWVGDCWMGSYICAGGSNKPELEKYAFAVYPLPSNDNPDKSPKTATVWVYLGDGLR